MSVPAPPLTLRRPSQAPFEAAPDRAVRVRLRVGRSPAPLTGPLGILALGAFFSELAVTGLGLRGVLNRSWQTDPGVAFSLRRKGPPTSRDDLHRLDVRHAISTS